MGTKSSKPMAIATATLVVQNRLGDDIAPGAAQLEFAIDSRPILRRVGPAASRQNADILELECDVEYGPVMGAYESDLRRQLEIIARDLGAFDCAVLGFSRRELTRATDVTAALMVLEERARSIDVPLGARKDLSKKLVRLRRAANEGPSAPPPSTADVHDERQPQSLPAVTSAA